MTDFQIKFKFIFLRYLLIAASFIGIYTFLNWWLVLDTDTVHLSDVVTNIIGPLVLPFIPVLIWLRPRIKLLVFNTTGRRDPAAFYIMLASFTIGGTTCITQEYITTATGKLTQLENISTINNKPLTKYYTLKYHFIDKQHCQTFRTYGTSDKGSKLNWDYYIVCPIYTDSVGHLFNFSGAVKKNDSLNAASRFEKISPSALIVINGIPVSRITLSKINPQSIASIDVFNSKTAMILYGNAGKEGAILFTLKNATPVAPKAWLGVHYSKQVSNRLSQSEKDTLQKDFLKNSFRDFQLRDQERFIYLDRIGYGTHRTYYTKAINYEHDFGKYPIVFEAVNEPFEARNGEKLKWLVIAFAAGSALLLFIMQFPPVNKLKLKELMPDDPGKLG